MTDGDFLHAIVGPEGVRAGSTTDAVDGAVPRWVVRPASAEEAAAVVRASGEKGLAVVPRGRGRHLEFGNPPGRVDLILSTERLTRVLAHEPADMTVCVQAGCSVPVLGSVLYDAGQWLPLDPPGAADTTIGGLLSTNLSGPLRASQGTARDLLIGIRVVAPDGALLSGGGRVVKNVAGYDLPKMYVGALGTLGLIVDATFKVCPRPSHEEAIAIACSTAEQAGAMALTLRDATEPFWLQIVSEPKAVDTWEVVLGAAGRREEVDAALQRYRSVASAHSLVSRPLANARERRHEIADRGAVRGHAVLRANTLPTEVGPCLASLRAAAARHGGTTSLYADVPSGVIRATLGRQTDLVGTVAELRPVLERAGGALVVERATAAEKRSLEVVGGVFGEPGPGLRLMRDLKSAFDPSRCFAPGRFVGGI